MLDMIRAKIAAKNLLKKDGIDLAARDDSGRTIWLYVIQDTIQHGEQETLQLAKFLLYVKEIRKDINVQDHEGGTALSYAAQYGYASVAKRLLKVKGIDVDNSRQ